MERINKLLVKANQSIRNNNVSLNKVVMRRIKLMIERAVKLRKYMRQRQKDAAKHMNEYHPYLHEMNPEQYKLELAKYYESYPAFKNE